ncbi:hypothetical protein WOLCODRAFT_97010 [Wolfiporia cocos MD-104 SS10]|uniref:25S rRNA adenine-N(1) methyltransferase n=1 Tax=Wolfiporia cocos (strain MD-104) TaxID=742152 RepID=A0A2H3JKW2_WOLCO|nr:hypothetical protein WOLCODRAFT_97010 [Wolfiporia cocos MD-104 SS10]
MPKARKPKRKVPVTKAESSTHPGSSSNPAATRTLIRRFHVLLKQKTRLEKEIRDGTVPNGRDAKLSLMEIEREIEELGGLGAYQRMSTIGQGSDRGGGSEKVLIGWLQELGIHSRMQTEKKRLRLLEVGALKPDNYASCSSWIDTLPIDLRSNHPSIMEQDFLLINEAEHRERWDAISLSLVLNFVPDAKDRGKMLRLAYSLLRQEGVLFLALPLPCISNSRYFTLEHLDGLMQSIGFSTVKTRWKEGGKMAYWIFCKGPATSITRNDQALYEKKTVLRTGKRNNFTILL